MSHTTNVCLPSRSWSHKSVLQIACELGGSSLCPAFNFEMHEEILKWIISFVHYPVFCLENHDRHSITYTRDIYLLHMNFEIADDESVMLF